MTPMPTPCSPLFAAGFDWLEALLPFLFVAFWIISQVFAVLRRIGGGPQPPARIDRPRPQPRPAGDLRSELEKQIEEFLRQSSGEQSRRPAPQAEPARPVPGPARPAPEPVVRRPPPAAPPAQPPRPVTAPSRPARTERERPAVDPREARRRTRPATVTPSSAAAPLPSAVEPVARHVQDAFSHDLAHSRGGLAHEATPPEPAQQPGSLAAELAEMLRSPAATRRAILLSEVLERPVDRW
jgi:hypothetical protein